MVPFLTRVHKDTHSKQHNNFHTLSHKNAAIQAWVMKIPEHSVRHPLLRSACLQKKRFHASTLTGWSASNSEPYIKTRWALSRSEILRGNHGISPKSEEKDMFWMWQRTLHWNKDKPGDTTLLAQTRPKELSWNYGVRQNTHPGNLKLTPFKTISSKYAV